MKIKELTEHMMNYTYPNDKRKWFLQSYGYVEAVQEMLRFLKGKRI